MVLFGMFGAALIAWSWASTHTAKPIDAFLVDQAKSLGLWLCIFVLPGVLARKNPLTDLRTFALPLAPWYLVGLVPPVVAMTVEWEGGWFLGIGGAAMGAVSGVLVGWLFARWTLPDIEIRRHQPARAYILPFAFAALFALFGAYNWGIEWLTLDQAWVIPVTWMLLAVPGALVGRLVLGVLVMSPFELLMLMPLLGSMTVGWQGGWVLGIAGAAVGAAAGAATGWMFKRWIMPEYDKRRAREDAARPPRSTVTSSGPDAEHLYGL
jgi:hypothetical protein